MSAPFRLLRGDAPVGFGAGPSCVWRIEVGGREGGWNFCPLVAPYGLKNVPTHIEIIEELPACHVGAVTYLSFIWLLPPGEDPRGRGHTASRQSSAGVRSSVATSRRSSPSFFIRGQYNDGDSMWRC